MRVQELTVELEKSIRHYNTKNELLKLENKIEAKIKLRNNRILKVISWMSSIVLQEKTEENLGNGFYLYLCK
jgi:Mg2+ and Co2+ transporter CorA